MSFFSRFSRGAQLRAQNTAVSPNIEEKASRVGPLLSLYSLGRPKWTDRNYAALAREGFEKNAIVYRAVRMVAEAAASVPWLMFEGRQEITSHPLLDLLQMPNPHEAGTVFLETLFGNLFISGNAYGYNLAGQRTNCVLNDGSAWNFGYDFLGQQVGASIEAQLKAPKP